MDQLKDLPIPPIEISPTPEPPQTEYIRPATWGDLFLYLFGGLGLLLLTTFIASFFIREMNETATFITIFLNFLCLTGSVVGFGIWRHKLSLRSMGLLIPAKKILLYAGLGSVLAVVALLPRLMAASVFVFLEWVINGDISSLTMREDLFTTGLDTWYGILIMLVGVGVLAPIAEELFFRGLLYDWFRQKAGVVWAVILSSVLFGFAHFDSMIVVASALVMGVIMAIAYEKTKSLWITIFMHIATNTGAMLLVVISALQ